MIAEAVPRKLTVRHEIDQPNNHVPDHTPVSRLDSVQRQSETLCFAPAWWKFLAQVLFDQSDVLVHFAERWVTRTCAQIKASPHPREFTSANQRAQLVLAIASFQELGGGELVSVVGCGEEG